MKNHCKDYFKASKPVLFSELQVVHEDGSVSDLIEQLAQEDDVAELFHQQFTSHAITKVLHQLDEESQELIHARYVLQCSYEDLSQQYGMTNETIRQRISRIIKKLRDLLAHYQDDLQ